MDESIDDVGDAERELDWQTGNQLDDPDGVRRAGQRLAHTRNRLAAARDKRDGLEDELDGLQQLWDDMRTEEDRLHEQFASAVTSIDFPAPRAEPAGREVLGASGGVLDALELTIGATNPVFGFAHRRSLERARYGLAGYGGAADDGEITLDRSGSGDRHVDDIVVGLQALVRFEQCAGLAPPMRRRTDAHVEQNLDGRYGTASKLGETPPSIILSHELVHADDQMNGTLEPGGSPENDVDGNPTFERNDDGNLVRQIEYNRELDAVGLTFDPWFGDRPTEHPGGPSENSIREELGLPPRQEY